MADLYQEIVSHNSGDHLIKRVLGNPNSRIHGLHLVVMDQPYLQWLLEGKKTTEARFSKNRMAPYGAVQQGDWLLLKQTCGPVIGLCCAAKVQFHELNEVVSANLRSRYATALCADASPVWQARWASRYVTLVDVDWPSQLLPVRCQKRDRRGWVVLEPARKSGYLGH